MQPDLRSCLNRLRGVQDVMRERALSDVLEPRVRAAYFDAETRLSVALGELDYLVNLKE